MIRRVVSKAAVMSAALLLAAGMLSGCSDAYDVVNGDSGESVNARSAFKEKGDRIYVVAESQPSDRMQFCLDLGSKTISSGTEITFYTTYKGYSRFPAETEICVRDGGGEFTKWNTTVGDFGEDTGNSNLDGWYPVSVKVPSSYKKSTNLLGFTFASKNFEQGSVIAVKNINIAQKFDAGSWDTFSTKTELRFQKDQPAEWNGSSYENPSKEVTRRALAIANVDNVAICDLDIISLEKMFKTQTFDGKPMAYVEKAKNLSLSQIKNKIKNVYADTDKDDVSYLVLSCHGDGNGNIWIGYNSETGDDEAFTGKTLRKTLDQYVQGEVVVFIDCCFAGQAIVRSASSKSADEIFMEKFVSDFFSTSTTRSGELASKRFHVLCSSSHDELSAGGEIGAGINSWEKGLGWDALGDKKISLKADKNKDKKVTLAELYAYAEPLTAHLQNQLVYPENDSFIIGGRY